MNEVRELKMNEWLRKNYFHVTVVLVLVILIIMTGFFIYRESISREYIRMEDALTAAREEREIFRSSNAELTEHVKTQDSTIAEWNETIAALTGEVELLRRENTNASEDMAKLAEQVRRQAAAFARWDKAMTELSSEIEELKQTKAELYSQIKNITSDGFASKEEIDDLYGKISQWDVIFQFLNMIMSEEIEIGAPSAAMDGAEATRVINDIRTLKSACLLYYADKLAWPAQSEAGELDKYADRPIVSSGRYGGVLIKSVSSDGVDRSLVGVTLNPDVQTEGVREKLAEKALDAGLWQLNDGAPAQYRGDLTVYMILH
jgi:general secretion pathway protein G